MQITTIEAVVEKTRDFIRQKLENDSSGHDWWHIHRVWQNALHIARMEQDRLQDREKIDMTVVNLAALLHDIADWKFSGDDKAGAVEARKWLESLQVDESTIAHVCEIIDTVSFKGAGVTTQMRTHEGKIVQDADRLDALGAVGIGRTFAYGGHTGRKMHDPECPPEMHQSFEQYKKSKGPTINHFYEKLLLLKERMNTQSARQLAEARHTYMEEFLAQFFAECNGER